MSVPRTLLIACQVLVMASFLPSSTIAHDDEVTASGQLDSKGVWTLHIELSAPEFAAMEPAAPQGLAFGGPTTVRRASDEPKRETVPNLFGTQFPWVHGILTLPPGRSSAARGGQKCRLRYDGDFTYIMAAGSPKRPLFLELLEGKPIEGSRRFRLHAMQFDPTMLRERVAAHVFAKMKVPVSRVIHAEVELVVGEQEPQRIGLYTALEAVDAELLTRNEIPAMSLMMQINGLNSIQYIGDEWTAYSPLFRATRVPTKQEQDRIIALAKLIGEASDDEFKATINEFIDTSALLRYVAGNSLTSNLTGFSSIGANDYLCLAPDGKFHVITSEMEVAMSGAVLAGAPDQLVNLSLTHPYAGECKLVDRLMKEAKMKDEYFQIVQDFVNTSFTIESMNAVIDSIEMETTDARTRESNAAAERVRRAPAGFGPGQGLGLGPGGPAMPAPMDIRTFVAKRIESITKQLAGNDRGYVPVPPNFGGFGSGGNGGGSAPPRRQTASAPITEAQFSESVQVPPDFIATLFAKSPEVNYPVAIAAEPSGAIYVASDEQGSLGTDRNGGKVLRCVDADGDGAMDSVTTFCRVDHVRGVVYRGGAVWVCHPPFLSVFHDDNSDGVADRSQQLVSGLTTELVNTRGGDHTTNGIRMGIDGWLYVGDGDYGVPEAKGVDGSTVVLRGGGILRVRPDGTELELFASGLRNPFDIAIDPQLNMFTRDNTNDGGGWDTRVSQLFQSAEYGYPRLFANFSDEIMPTLGAFGSGGGTGSLYIDDPTWPARFNKSLFTSDWGRSAVFHHPLTAAGPTFALTQESFATIPRATGMDIDAAGNLYVASWWSGEASVYVGPQVGFVTRITPKRAVPREFASLSSVALDELIELLQAPQAVVRFHAQGEFIKRGESATIAALSHVAADNHFLLEGRVAAMFAIKQVEGAKANALLISLTNDATVREFAIRALSDRKTQLEGLTAENFTPFLSDTSPRIVAQALIALGRLGDASTADLILPLAEQSGTSRPDPAEPNVAQVIPHLALRTLVELNAVDACLKALDDAHWQAALRALRNMHSAKAVDGLIARLQNELNTDKRTAILITLIRLYQHETQYDASWWGIRPDTTGPFYDPMTWEKSRQIKTVLTTAIKESDVETAALLRAELMRHQVELPGLSGAGEAMKSEAVKPIEIERVDPSNPNQLGNMPFAAALEKVLAIKSDAESGAAIFRARSCNACHTSAAGQKPIGPHLADIGRRYKTNELVESILKPSEKIAQGFETQMIVLTSGKVLSGFVISENGRQISLRDSQGITHAIPRNEIEERERQKVSAMPEGLAGSLEPQQLADLIAYLKSL